MVDPARELGERLLDDHRVDQERIGRVTVERLAPLWRIIDTENVDSSATVWVDAALPVVAEGFRESQETAGRFVRDYRQAMVPDAEPMVSVEFDDFPTERATVSVIVTGPVEVKRQLPSPDAGEKGFVGSSGAAVKVVADGGRQAVEQMVDLDEEAIGFARKCDSKPCYFCAMLASRGAVYKKDSFELANSRFRGEGVAKTHDNCQCTLRPVYDEDDDLDEEAEEYWRIWEESTEGLSNAEERRAFRRAFENRDVPEPKGPTEVPVTTLERVRQDLLDEGFAEDSFQVQFYDRQIERFGDLQRPSTASDGNRVPEDMSVFDDSARVVMEFNETRDPLSGSTNEKVEALSLSPVELKRAELVARNEAALRDLAPSPLEQDDLVTRSHEGLKLFAADKDVAINVPSEGILWKILADGRLRSQRDPSVTETGGGGYLPEQRELYETVWFGEHETPPIYGYLRDRSGKESGADDYGDIALVLNAAAKESTTVVVGDSLDDRIYTFPGSLNTPGRYTGNPTEAAEHATAQDYADYLNGVGVESDPDDFFAYDGFYADNHVEAQIHNGVTVEDIAFVHFKGDPPSEGMIERLAAAGISYTLAEER